jgi:hypothetical protein
VRGTPHQTVFDSTIWRVGISRDIRVNPHQPGAASTIERLGGSRDVHVTPHQPDAACTIDETVGRLRDVLVTPHQSGAASTIDERVGSSSDVRVTPHQLGAPSTSERLGRLTEARILSYQRCAGSKSDVGGAATPSTSSTNVFSAALICDSSSDGESEKCPVCFVTFVEENVATPNTCDHIFCVGCLENWSEHMNTCPIDQQVFNAILVRRYPNRRFIREIPVIWRPRQD